MTDQPLPDSSELTRDDFIHSGWREVIGDAPMTHCAMVEGHLRKTADEALEEGNLPQAKVLRLLAGACSMKLTNKSRSEPYGPMWVWDGRSSPTPDWFSESDINFLAEILNDVDDPMLKGRLADLVWLKTPSGARFALEAIDSYRSLNLTEETWASEVRDCWKRALVLATMLGTGAGDRIKAMGDDLMAKFDTATKEDGRFGQWLAETMGEFGLGRNDEEKIAEKLEALGQEFENDGNFPSARAYYNVAGDWFAAGSLNTKQIDMLVAVAEGWAKEAEQRMSSDNPSASVAAGFYDKSIQSYREIPGSEREARQVNERITELMHLHDEVGKLASDEMGTISIPGVDIMETVRQARNAVAGREPMEALNCLASLHHTSVESLRDLSLENLKNFPLVALIPRIIISHDGRVAAKTSGMTPAGNAEENEPAIRAQMIQDYRITVDCVVRGRILPALQILHIEHRFAESDFIVLALNSPAVPPGRGELFGKALFNGYEYDFPTALHLLTPQVENMVRHRLKSTGVNTKHIDHQGIEDEKSLSSLVEAPEFEKIFGQDLAFEIRTLFCDHLGRT